ncbi:MAG TPA: ATP-binding protein [Acidimicrobiia bacterium]|nr:ATP-binding protein [Acidimicrobiia bacterium]
MLTLRLSPEPASATRAREVTRSHIRAACPPEVVDTAALLVTELVSNVVVHALTDMLLVVDVAPGRIEVAVQDGSPERPALQDPAVDAVAGRGLAIVDELATAWGVEEQHGKKVVWAALEFPATAGAVSGR